MTAEHGLRAVEHVLVQRRVDGPDDDRPREPHPTRAFGVDGVLQGRPPQRPSVRARDPARAGNAEEDALAGLVLRELMRQEADSFVRQRRPTLRPHPLRMVDQLRAVARQLPLVHLVDLHVDLRTLRTKTAPAASSQKTTASTHDPSSRSSRPITKRTAIERPSLAILHRNTLP